MSLLNDLSQLPDAALVPVGWVRERLGVDEGDRPHQQGVPRDLTITEMAGLARCSESAMRTKCRDGAVAGARKLDGLGWRCAPDLFAEFLAGTAPAPAAAPWDPTQIHLGTPPRRTRRLGAWREDRPIRKGNNG